jgi:transglutaminase-like putative cysteine protease
MLLTCIISISGVCASEINNQTNTASSDNGILNSNEITISNNTSVSTVNSSSSTIASSSVQENSQSYSVSNSNSNLKSSSASSNQVGSVIQSTNINTVLTGYDFTETYGEGKNYTVILTTTDGTPIVGQHISMNLTRPSSGAFKVYWATTDLNGVANLQINLVPNSYNIKSNFGGLTHNGITYQASSATINKVTVYAKGSTLTPTNIVTNPYTAVYGTNGAFNFTLVDSNGNPISGQTVYLNFSKGSGSKVYPITTNSNGKGSLTIGMAAGTAKIILNYNGNSKYAASSTSTTVTILPAGSVKNTAISGTSGSITQGTNYEVALVDSNGNPVVGQTVYFTISRGSNSATYSNVTNSNGVAYLSINLMPRDYNITYTYKGSTLYLSSTGSKTVTVVAAPVSLTGNAIWVYGKDMSTVNLKTLADDGINNIFLNYAAISLNGRQAVVNWVAQANKYGINVHIWMQVLYHGGFQNPIDTSTGGINTTLLNSDIQEAIEYASIPGIRGINLDYMRYPGTAYKYTNGTQAVTYFVTQLVSAIKNVNSSLLVSGSLMPETTNGAYYYGQDVTQLGKYLDILVPMIYKGNYNQDSAWITSTTKWYVSHSSGAVVWVGLQSYVSDSDTTKLSTTALAQDVKAAYDGGAYGVSVFRYGLVNLIDFNNYNTTANTSTANTVSINSIASAATSLKSLIEGSYKGQIPDYVTIDGVTYTTAQFLYLLTTAIGEINSGSTTPISTITIKNPTSSDGDTILSNMSKTDYSTLANTISNYLKTYQKVQTGYSTTLGTIHYNTLVYTFTKVMAFYYSNGKLPATVWVTDISNNYYINVVALPSASNYAGFTYAYYNTTFVNYCPHCGLYGTLQNNPKNTAEGELTCAYDGADYCAVTGKEKITNSNYVLTKYGTSTLVNGGSGNGSNIVGSLTLNDIKSIAATVYNNLNKTGSLPSYVSYNGVDYTLAQVSYLMGQAILNINSGNSSGVDFIDVDSPSNSTGTVKGTLSLTNYIALINRIVTFVNTYNTLPNYDKTSSNGIGQISFETYTYAFSKILVFDDANGRLPNSVIFDSSVVGTVSNTNSSTNVNNDVYVTIADVISAASRVQAYIQTNGKLPNYTTINGTQYSEPQFVYLMAIALQKISAGQKDNIKVLDLTSAPNANGDNITGSLSSSAYLGLAQRIAEFAAANGYVPNFDSSNGLGKISYDNYVYILANVLTSYSTNSKLPSTINVDTSIITTASSSSVSASGTGLNEKADGSDTSAYLVATLNCEVNNAQIQALASSLTSGLSSTLAKATAIYNYVRDNIAYSYYANTKYGAVGTLNAGKGNCVDHAHLVIALCRAAGIPARYVHGQNCVFSSGLVTGHVWAQVLVDGTWKVADATSKRNSLGAIVNWNTGSFTLASISSSLSF